MEGSVLLTYVYIKMYFVVLERVPESLCFTWGVGSLFWLVMALQLSIIYSVILLISEGIHVWAVVIVEFI